MSVAIQRPSLLSMHISTSATAGLPMPPQFQRRDTPSTSTSSKSSSVVNTKPNVIRITLPPHKDWYTMKPIPRAPLPLYHPLRVVKRPAPRATSTALPLTRKISPLPESNLAARPARSRRPPLKLRDAGGLVSPTSEKEDVVVNVTSVTEVTPAVVKTRRPRRKKAEILAEKAAAGEIITPRKRRRRGVAGAAEEEEEAEEEMPISPTPRKRRRRNAIDQEESEKVEPTTEPTSTYGTRSRTANNITMSASASASAAEDASVAGDEERAPSPGPRKRGGKGRKTTSPLATPIEGPQALPEDQPIEAEDTAVMQVEDVTVNVSEEKAESSTVVETIIRVQD